METKTKKNKPTLRRILKERAAVILQTFIRNYHMAMIVTVAAPSTTIKQSPQMFYLVKPLFSPLFKHLPELAPIDFSTL
jgi:ribosomal protein L21E